MSLPPDTVAMPRRQDKLAGVRHDDPGMPG
jgi:hypothetical protein